MSGPRCMHGLCTRIQSRAPLGPQGRDVTVDQSSPRNTTDPVEGGVEAQSVEAWRSREELADFLEHAPVPIHRVDEAGTLLWANRAELALLGYAADEYIGHPISAFHVDQSVLADML